MTLATLGPRSAVIGTAGTGKSTLARQLAERTGVPHVELDELFRGPDWTQAPRDVFHDLQHVPTTQ